MLGDDERMKKLIILVLLSTVLVSCSLLDEVNKEDAERGRKCYRTSSGYFYCEKRKYTYEKTDNIDYTCNDSS